MEIYLFLPLIFSRSKRKRTPSTAETLEAVTAGMVQYRGFWDCYPESKKPEVIFWFRALCSVFPACFEMACRFSLRDANRYYVVERTQKGVVSVEFGPKCMKLCLLLISISRCFICFPKKKKVSPLHWTVLKLLDKENSWWSF